MATTAERAKAEQERKNSAAKRRPGARSATSTAREDLHAATAASGKGRALHAPTKQRADAKAGKPDPGRVPPFWKTGNNGGEPQTVNNVTEGRGADAPASVRKASRKSTRGAWPGGEKDAQLPRARTRDLYAPSARAARGR